METKLRLAKLLIGCGVALLVMLPSPAFAHDNLGGDELAVAWWMLVAALVVLVMGVLAAIWAARAGQFTNIEESKYRMLDNADDYDAIMAEADKRVLEAKAAAPEGDKSAKEPTSPETRSQRTERVDRPAQALK